MTIMSVQNRGVHVVLLALSILCTVLAVYLRNMSFQEEDRNWPDRQMEMKRIYARTGGPVAHIPDRHWSQLGSPIANLAAGLILGLSCFLMGRGRWETIWLILGWLLGGLAWGLATLPFITQAVLPLEQERSALLWGITAQTIAVGGPISSALFLVASQRIETRILGGCFIVGIVASFSWIHFRP